MYRDSVIQRGFSVRVKARAQQCFGILHLGMGHFHIHLAAMHLTNIRRSLQLVPDAGYRVLVPIHSPSEERSSTVDKNRWWIRTRRRCTRVV